MAEPLACHSPRPIRPLPFSPPHSPAPRSKAGSPMAITPSVTPGPPDLGTHDTPTSAPRAKPFETPVEPQVQSPLLRVPAEIIQRILSAFDSEDIVSLARAAKTCRELRSYVYENPDQAIWRALHLQSWDDPRTAGAFPRPRENDEVDWRKRVKDREFVSRILLEWDEDRLPEAIKHFDLICDTLLDLYLDAPPALNYYPNHPVDPNATSYSTNCELLEGLIESPLFVDLYHHHIKATMPTPPHEPSLRPYPSAGASASAMRTQRPEDRLRTSPKLARLHCFLPPIYDKDDDRDREWRGEVRKVVYSAKNFGDWNDWGPFTRDGKIDWVLMDALGSVMMTNAQEITQNPSINEHWQESTYPRSGGVGGVRGWGFNGLKRPADLPDGQAWDWAGVQGTWCGSYAFLDYTDWVQLNEPRLIMLRGRITQLDLTRYHEAVGDLMRLELVVDNSPDDHPIPPSSPGAPPPSPLPPVTTNLPTSSLLPPIYFHGSSLQSNNVAHPSPPMSFVRGVVQLTADDPPQVRWTLVIRYGGEDRWRLECAEVAGRGARRGMFGVWTDALKEEHSPNGPVWYWKA
ncbi:hypothetical protein IAT38_003411 [Cryptococcus sp. DSM 104549]